MRKRSVVAFSGMLVALMAIIVRVLELSQGGLSKAAEQQSRLTITVANVRGTIYDRNLRPLVNGRTSYRACVAGFPEAIAAVAPQLDEQAMAELEERLRTNRPAVVTLAEPPSLVSGLAFFQVPERYTGNLLSPHLLGYLDGDGLHGVTGVEQAFDDYLTEHSGKATVTYKVDGAGRPLQGENMVLTNTLDEARAGVVLTLDQDIQRIAETAAKKSIQRGAMVVMEPATGRILAMVSLPSFQPDTVARYLDSEDAPLLNRALCNYNCGSVFKITSLATALEQGISPDTCYTCSGQLVIGENKFHCHNRLGHGVLNMTEGFSASCNPYFVQLMQAAGGKALYRMSTLLGYDRSLILAEGIKTARAVLPSEEELLSPAAVANLSFGQGSLLASPVHIAQMVAAVVNDGQVIRPTILLGYADKEGTITEEEPAPPQTAFSAKTAATIREMMVKVVEEGTGKSALPAYGGAGGKTGTAETGWEQKDKAVVQGWFAGYYPAEEPRYVMAVIAEDTNNTGSKAAPVFKEICDKIYELEQSRGAGHSPAG